MKRRNFFASIISAVVVRASVELGVFEDTPCAMKWDPLEYLGEWRWINIRAMDSLRPKGDDYVRSVFFGQTRDLNKTT